MVKKKVVEKRNDNLSIDELYKKIENLEKEVSLLNNNFIFCKKHAEKAGTEANEYKKIIIKLEQENKKLLDKLESLNLKRSR